MVPMNFLYTKINAFDLFRACRFVNQICPEEEVRSYVCRTGNRFNRFSINYKPVVYENALAEGEKAEAEKSDMATDKTAKAETETKTETPAGDTSADAPKGEGNKAEAVESKKLKDEDKSLIVSVMMFMGQSHKQLLDNSGLFDSKTKSRISRYNKSVIKNLNLLIESDKGNYFLPGGYYSPFLDGENVEDMQTLINTAIRNVKRQTSIDLSKCQKWHKVVEYHYKRPGTTPQKTVVFIPSICRGGRCELF